MLMSQREIHMQNIKKSVKDSGYLDSVVKRLSDKLAYQLVKFDGLFPAACSIDGVYPLTPKEGANKSLI